MMVDTCSVGRVGVYKYLRFYNWSISMHILFKKKNLFKGPKLLLAFGTKVIHKKKLTWNETSIGRTAYKSMLVQIRAIDKEGKEPSNYTT